MKSKNGYFTQHFPFDPKTIQKELKTRAVVPYGQDKEGATVIYLRMQKLVPGKSSEDKFTKYFFLQTERNMANGRDIYQQNGVTVVDFKNMGWKNIAISTMIKIVILMHVRLYLLNLI